MLPSFLPRRAVAVAALLTTMASASAAPVYAQSASDYDVDINVDSNPPGPYILCPMTLAFHAVLTAKNPTAPNLPTFPVTYHWVRKGFRTKDQTFNVDGATGESYDFVSHPLSVPWRGTLTFVITKPFHYSKTTADLDIICH